MDVYAAGFFEDHGEASAELFVEIGNDSRKGFNDSDLSAQGTEDGCEFAADDAASDDDQFTHRMIQIKKFIAGYDKLRV